jgi:hypothetical protein
MPAKDDRRSHEEQVKYESTIRMDLLRMNPTTSRGALAPAVVLVVPLIIYLCFLTQNYYWDGIFFAQIIEEAGGEFKGYLLHPNHLIYNVIGLWLYKAVLALGINVRALLVLQVANAFFSAAAAAVLFYTLNRLFRSVSLAVVLTLLFSFSATWWRFSIDADPYIASVLFMLISLALILPDDKPRPIALALTHSASMCFHQLSVFFFPVALLGLYFQASSLSRKRRLTVLFSYAAVAFAVTFGAYSSAYYAITSEPSVRGFSTWVTHFSPDVGFTFKFGESLAHTLRGQIKLFLEGRLNFLREVVSIPIVVLLVIFAAALIGLVHQAYRAFRDRPTADGPSDRRLLLLCLVWIGIYVIFLFFWLPHNTFYRLFYFPAFIILLGIWMRRYSIMERQWWLAPCLVLVVAISNFVFFVYPYSRIRKETPLAVATELTNIWTNRSVVYFQQMDSDNMLLRYFNPQASWKQVDIINLEYELDRDHLQGKEVWIDVSTLELINQSPDGKVWLDRHAITGRQVRVADPTYNVVFTPVVP